MGNERKVLQNVAKELGYEVAITKNGHYRAWHPVTHKIVILSGTPSDARGIRNAILKLQRAAGLSKRGRKAVEGQRRDKTRQQETQSQPAQQPSAVPTKDRKQVIGAQREWFKTDQLMRQRP